MGTGAGTIKYTQGLLMSCSSDSKNCIWCATNYRIVRFKHVVWCSILSGFQGSLWSSKPESWGAQNMPKAPILLFDTSFPKGMPRLLTNCSKHRNCIPVAQPSFKCLQHIGLHSQGSMGGHSNAFLLWWWQNCSIAAGKRYVASFCQLHHYLYFTAPHLCYWTPIGLLRVQAESQWSPNEVQVEMPKGSTSCNAAIW